MPCERRVPLDACAYARRYLLSFCLTGIEVAHVGERGFVSNHGL